MKETSLASLATHAGTETGSLPKNGIRGDDLARPWAGWVAQTLGYATRLPGSHQQPGGLAGQSYAHQAEELSGRARSHFGYRIEEAIAVIRWWAGTAMPACTLNPEKQAHPAW